MIHASRKRMTLAPDLRVRGVGMRFVDVVLRILQLESPAQSGGNSTL
jgi:hypothetical protein